MLVLAGTPMYILEASIGQLTSSGVLGCWKMCPVFKGVGYGATIMAFWLNLYYIVLLSWACFYFVNSFQSPLPWVSCNNWWNTENCYEDEQVQACNKMENAVSTATPMMPMNFSCSKMNGNGTASVREFWIRYTLQLSDGIDEPGEIRWQLALCLVAMWTLCYFCIWKGVKWTGKVVYFTAVFPYILLIVLFVRAITLPGALNGVHYYLFPRFEEMLNSQVWIKAATQIFFSHGLGVGAVIALGSYNRFHNNIYRDALMLSCVDCCTAVFAGLVVFATVGFMAEVRQEDVSAVAASGPGLAFLAYPAAVAQLPLAPMWAVLFFFMIMLLGIDSQFCTVEGFLTAWVDEFPALLRRRKEIFLLCVTIASCIVGISMITQGGIYVFDLIDHFSQTMTLLFIIFLECTAVAWSYGVDNFMNDMSLMIGYKPFVFWKYAWSIFTPTICAVRFSYIKFAN